MCRREAFTRVAVSRYNIAAYRIAESLGLDDMMPVTVGKVEWDWDDQRPDERHHGTSGTRRSR